MADRYSAIVMGGGHNGLVAANYLAMEGLSVLVLERRDFVGGACITEELFPDFRISSCSYICHLLQGPVIDQLGLRQHGLQVYPVDPFRFTPLPGGQRMLLWHDDQRTAEEIKKISPKDAERFNDWAAFWERAAGILHHYFLTEPPSTGRSSGRGAGHPR